MERCDAARPDAAGDRGAGMAGTSAGVLVFLLLLFAAVQILFNLYANTMVTSAAHEAARRVAGHTAATDPCAAIDDANALFADALGPSGAYALGVERAVWTSAARRSSDCARSGEER